MSGGPTIVVKFGESVSSADQNLFVVELDDELNTETVDGKQQVKNQFYPGDEIYFLMHYDHAKLVVKAIKTTDGQVVVMGQVCRSKTNEMLFEAPDEPLELQHTPSSGLSAEWYGRTSVLTRSGRSVTAASTPCIGDLTYTYMATSCKLVPPALTLAVDEEYPIAIVIYVEAA